MSLNFKNFQEINSERNKIAYDGDCVLCTPSQWLQALVGELGEYANFRKKFERKSISEDTFLTEAKKELADVVCYLFLLASSLDIDLESATIDKFNEVSDRIGSPIKIKEN